MSTILIVEDNINTLLFLSVNLTVRGFTIQGTSNAEDAITLIRVEAPELILLDLNLPLMGGLDLLDLLVQRVNQPAIPVIILSASAKRNKEIILASYSFVAAVLEKPVSLDDLLESVRYSIKA